MIDEVREKYIMSDVSITELRAKAKEHGINSFGIKKDELVKMIADAEKPVEAAETATESVEIAETVSKPVQENFVPYTNLDKFLREGWKVAELDKQAGFSISADVRHIYIKAVNNKSLAYVRK